MSEAPTPGEKHNARQREAVRVSERAAKQSLESLMNTPYGRKFIWDRLAFSHVFETSYVPDSFDRTAFREGERNVGQRLLLEVQQWTPAQYLTMTRENTSVTLTEESPSDE